MSNTRFDLEQQIMQCWGIVDDLDYVLQAVEYGADDDQLMNILIGLKELYSMKFEKTFNTFEKMLKEQAEEKVNSIFPEKTVEPFGY